VKIRGTLVFFSVKLCIQYLYIVSRKILLRALARPKIKMHEGKNKTYSPALTMAGAGAS